MWENHKSGSMRRRGSQEPLLLYFAIPWSENMRKTQRRIARLHAGIANIRANTFHHLTTVLVERFDVSSADWSGHFSVVDGERIRMRRLPRKNLCGTRLSNLRSRLPRCRENRDATAVTSRFPERPSKTVLSEVC